MKGARLLARCARLRPKRRKQPAQQGTLVALRTLVTRAQALTREERELKREIEALTRELAAPLLDEPGVGPISAAQILIAWSHQGRLHSEAAFARPSGSAPIPASSGQTVRHRLDRGGDRKLNRALHTIIVSRRKNHQPTTASSATSPDTSTDYSKERRCQLDIHRSITIGPGTIGPSC